MTTTWDLTGKIALITGGARGIGRATAAELARRGVTVVLMDIDEAELAAAVAEVPGASSVVADVRDYDACAAAVAQVLDRHGRLDIVWANAGIGVGGPVEHVEPDVWRQVVEVNLIGAYNTVRAALAAVIAAQGYVAVTASLASFAHAPMLSAYAASKAGVEAFADSLRLEVADQGVAVGSLHPTWIDTDMVRDGDRESKAFARLRASMRGPLAKTFPVQSVVGPIADAFAARSSRVYLPGFVRGAFWLRSLINLPALQRDQLKAAPEMRQLFTEQAAAEGIRQASLGSRWHR